MNTFKIKFTGIILILCLIFVSTSLTGCTETKGDYYIASKNSQVFHRVGCVYVSKIKDVNRVRYNSREEAVKVGKRGCSKCKP